MEILLPSSEQVEEYVVQQGDCIESSLRAWVYLVGTWKPVPGKCEGRKSTLPEVGTTLKQTQRPLQVGGL
jgi:hypothetical protein